MIGNEPAYPWGEHGIVLGGLTKRELIAAMAMQGMAMRVTDLFDHEVAGGAVRLADALLAELAKEPKE